MIQRLVPLDLLLPILIVPNIFHAKAQQRARTNNIIDLKRQDGSVCTNQDELEMMVMSFYQILFSAQELTQPDDVVRYVSRKVTDAQNEFLSSAFTGKGVRDVLFLMEPNKAPGSDGFTAGFYQKNWSLVGDDICRAVLEFLNGGDMPKVVNNIVIVLIPKIKNL
jgi:hypothetical protein